MTKNISAEDRRWPDPQQELLLKAALTSGESCLNAWKQWKTAGNIDTLEQTSRRILPLLYSNLRREGIDDPLLDTFKGIYRYTWYSNHLLFNSLTSLLQTFHKNQIQTVLLKGAALNILYYKDYGLRPMHDFDVLVPFDRARDALQIMFKNGWTPKFDLPAKISDTYLKYVHGTVLKNASGFDCDLHWNILEDSYLSPEGVIFFDNAQKKHFQDLPVYMLNPTDQLFHICVHGVRYHDEKNIRWIADALTVLKEDGGEIEWQELIHKAQKLGVFLPFKEAVQYLRRVFKIHLPPSVPDSISRIPVSKNEEKEFELKGRSLGRFGWIRYSWVRNLRSLDHSGVHKKRQKWIHFLKFYQNMWGIDHLWQLPLEKIKRTFKSASNSLQKK